MKRILRALAVGASTLVMAGCWPSPAQNADRTGHNPFESTITTADVTGLHERWRWTSPTGPTVNSPVVSSGGVHVTSECALFTLRPSTGEVRWLAPIPSSPDPCSENVANSTSEPYVVAAPEGDRVVAGYGAWFVRPPGFEVSSWITRAFDVDTGAVEGTQGLPFIGGARGVHLAGLHHGAAAPALAATRLTLHDLDATSGRGIVVSVDAAGSPPRSDLTLGTEEVFHVGAGLVSTQPGDGAQGQGVRAFPLAVAGPPCTSGSVTLECPSWVTPTDGLPTRPVIGAGGASLYVRTAAGTLYALDAATGAVQWTAGGLGSAGAPALADGSLYVPTGDGHILVFAADGCGGAPTCPPTRDYATGAGGAVSTPAVGGDVLYATSGGNVHAFAATGAGCATSPCPPLWSGPGAGAPVVSNGQLYVTLANQLIAYGTG